ADPSAVEWRSIRVLSVAVAVVAVPGRTLGKFCAQQFIDDLDRVDYSRIVGRAQAEAHQSQRVGADDLHRPRVWTGTAILDGNESQQRRSGSVAVVRRDADVVAFHSNLPREIAVHGVCPTFYVVVPGVSHLA